MKSSEGWTLSCGLSLVLGLQVLLSLGVLGAGWEWWALRGRVERLEEALLDCPCRPSGHAGRDRAKRQAGAPAESEVGWETEGVVLPTYSRVPLPVLAQFCDKAIGYCARQSLGAPLRGPPGPQGPQGPPGQRGRRGKCPAICPLRSNHTHRKEPSALYNSSATNQSQPYTKPQPPTRVKGRKSGNESLLADSDRPPPIKRHRPIQRKKKCFVTGVGPGESVGYRKVYYGAWMGDGGRRDERRWVTEHFEGTSLLEFPSEAALGSGASPSRFLDLPEMYDGTNHAVYQGGFFFHRIGTNKVVRMDLDSGAILQRGVPGAAYQGHQYLYAENKTAEPSLSYMDFATDEHGLWLIYRRHRRNYLVISHLDPRSLALRATWKLPKRSATRFGNAFVACGVLYGLRSASEMDSRLVWAYDLFTRRAAVLDVPWTNAYGRLTHLNYQPAQQRLQAYDNGHLLSFPLNTITRP